MEVNCFSSFYPLMPNLGCVGGLPKIKVWLQMSASLATCPVLVSVPSSSAVLTLLWSQTMQYCPRAAHLPTHLCFTCTPLAKTVKDWAWIKSIEHGFCRSGTSTRNWPYASDVAGYCVSQFNVELAHYTIQELFLKMFSSLLICGSDALDNPVEFSLLDCWLLPDTEC